MRKAFTAVFVLVFLTASAALAAPANEYEIPELYMTVEIPDGWAVFTRDVTPDDPNLAMMGTDAESLKKAMEQNRIYLNAVKTEPFSEINIVMHEEEKAFDMHRLSDEEIQEWMEADSDKAEQMGFTKNSNSFYEHKQARFIDVDVQREANGMIVYGKWYFTIINGQGISITLYSYDGKVTAEQEKTLKSVVDSIVFTEVKEKPANWMKYVIAGAVGAGVGAVVGLAVHIMKKRNKTKETTQKEIQP